MKLHRTKKFLHREVHQQNRKTTHRMGEHITNMSNKGLVSQIYKEQNSTPKKKNNSIKKMGKRPEETFLQGHTDGQWTYEKMFSVTNNHQGNANQNHNEISSHTCQNGSHQ